MDQPKRPWRPQEDANDGLITAADLKRHLPVTLPYRGRTLERFVFDAHQNERGELQYDVEYICGEFFDCPPALTEDEDTHGILIGTMTFERVPRERLGEVLREQLRDMYWELEVHVDQEVYKGCLVRPAADEDGMLDWTGAA
jgi:hypothetical protein